MLIEGFGIGGYRSLGEMQYIGPFEKINLFAGKNNSGKSNILNFILEKYNEIPGQFGGNLHNAGVVRDFDVHQGKHNKFNYAHAISLSNDYYKELISTNNSRYKNWIERIFYYFIKTGMENISWFDLSDNFPNDSLITEILNSKIIPDRTWYDLWKVLRGMESGGSAPAWVRDTLITIIRGSLGKVKVALIPSVRRIGEAGPSPEENDFSGHGIINKLAELQNPSIKDQKNKKRFDFINEFLRNIIQNESATIEIPYERDLIMVHLDQKTLPLSSLGTGVHETIIIATAATALENQVVCIEEPELHLHPIMERKLLRFLAEKTSNQYFITTHSAHILDTKDAAVFHVRLEDGQSIVKRVFSDSHKFSICHDLGYKASDLLQANCVIWVEGPSDCVYLNHWIKSVDETLIEGLHYSIMFYGGNLLSHLTANDPEIDEFISLRGINRNISILIDSDKASANKPINNTKKRVRDEFNVGPGFAWVTQGREIENYIEPGLYERAIKVIHPKAKNILARGKYDHLFEYSKGRGKIEKADKVKVAKRVVKSPANLDILDLQDRVERLVEFIKSSNGIDDN